MEYVFIPLDKIKIVEKFIDDYPIYLDFKSFVKNKDEKLYKKLPLYLVCEEKIINNKRILTDLLTSNDFIYMVNIKKVYLLQNVILILKKKN